MTQQQKFMWPHRPLLFLTPLILGGAVLALAIQMRTPPEKRVVEEVAQPARVITARKVQVVPRAMGLGESAPKRIWQAVCEVKGRIVEVHPRLQAGSAFGKDELLLRIDDADVKLSISRLVAEIARAKASLSELNANEANYREALLLEQESLKVANAEMERLKKLVSRNASSAAELDSKQRSLITQKQLVQSVRSKLNLLPTQIESAQAALKVAEANLAERQRDLQRCEIRVPFACRMGAVNLEAGQFIGVGEKLFTVQSSDGFLIDAEIASQDLRRLFDANATEQASDENRDPADVTADDRPSRFQVDVTLRYKLGGRINTRAGRFVRFREQLSDQTRSGIVVVETNAESDDGPPPIRGTLCEIELRGRVRKNRIVIPTNAIQRSDTVFVVDAEQRLRRRTVVVEFEQDDFAVIQSGVNDRDLVVVSQLPSAIEGCLIEPIADDVLQRDIALSATGSESSE